MKRIWELLILIVAAVLILTVFSGFQGASAQTEQPQTQQEDSMRRTVTVSGTGRVQITPDIATVVLGVDTEAESASEAMDQNSQQMQSLISALTDAGVAENDIRTESIQLYPRYESNPQPNRDPQIVGYTASNLVLVTVRDLDEVGGLLDTAIQAGGNRVQGITFEISDPVEAMDQARAHAISDARHKAEQIATLTESSLGEVVSIVESSYTPPPLFARGGAVSEQLAADVPVQPGTQSVELSLQVTWELSSTGVASPQTSAPSLDNAVVNIQPTSGGPGTELQVAVQGFPANETLNIAIGPFRSDYEVVDTVRTDRNGAVVVGIQVPSRARPSERWVVVVSLVEQPDRQIVSNAFNVTG